MAGTHKAPMLPLGLPHDPAAPLTVLCLGAHADDIEIGCGGTILHLLGVRPDVHVVWVVFSSPGERGREARAGASLFLEQAATPSRVIVLDFRDGFFPYEGAKIKECLEDLKKEVDPDLIFTHYRLDRHQDHRTISDLTWNTWRGQLIVEYEIPKYDGDLGQPNCFVPLSRELGARKIAHIREAFRSESSKAWFTEDAFQAILRLRGVECAAPEGIAEAFYCRKLTLALAPAGRAAATPVPRP